MTKEALPGVGERLSRMQLLELTASIVCAHASAGNTRASELPGLIRDVAAALRALEGNPPPGPEMPAREAEKQKPAVPVAKSIYPDYIVCLEDGRQFKMMKRYLMTKYGLSPEEYRRKWGLPATYPLVAPNYATKRSGLAKSTGLGKRRTDFPIGAGPGQGAAEETA